MAPAADKPVAPAQSLRSMDLWLIIVLVVILIIAFVAVAGRSMFGGLRGDGSAGRTGDGPATDRGISATTGRLRAVNSTRNTDGHHARAGGR